MNEIDQALKARADIVKKIAEYRDLLQAIDSRLYVLAKEMNVIDRTFAGQRMRLVEKPVCTEPERLAEIAPELVREKVTLTVDQRALTALWNAGADQQERLGDVVYVRQEIVVGDETRKSVPNGRA